jgi:hypothetical protein
MSVGGWPKVLAGDDVNISWKMTTGRKVRGAEGFYHAAAMEIEGRRAGADMITAAEIACFAYCPEQWRLQYGLELFPANRAALDAGNRHQWWKAVAERIAGRFIGVGRAIIIAVVLLLVLLWAVWR